MTNFPFVYALHPETGRPEPARLLDENKHPRNNHGPALAAVRFCGDPLVYQAAVVGEIEAPEVSVHRDGGYSMTTASQRSATYADGIARAFIFRDD
jgi:hypothetical protein